MIAVVPDCSSRRASNIRRPPLKISTRALAVASIRPRSRASHSVTECKRGYSLLISATGAGNRGSLAPWPNMLGGAGIQPCICACRDLARSFAFCTATAASKNGCCDLPVFLRPLRFSNNGLG